jgi:hypothetical protein
MTDRLEEKRRLENLELNRETLQDLTEGQGERAKGGAAVNEAEAKSGAPGCFVVPPQTKVIIVS